MRSYSGVTAGGFLPGLRGYCAHAVLGRYGAQTCAERAFKEAHLPAWQRRSTIPGVFSEVVNVSEMTGRSRIVEVTLPHGWDGDEAALIREIAERVGETVDVRIVRAAPPPRDGEPCVTVTAKHDTLSDRDAFEANIPIG